MNVYLSARFSSAKLCNAAAAAFLKPAGHTVVSRWHRPSVAGGHIQWDGSRSQAERFAQENLSDLSNASVFIGWIDDDARSGLKICQRGARHTELGIAWALGKACILISGGGSGEIEQIYHGLPNVKCVPDLQAAIRSLDDLNFELAGKLQADRQRDEDAIARKPEVVRELESDGYLCPECGENCQCGGKSRCARKMEAVYAPR